MSARTPSAPRRRDLWRRAGWLLLAGWAGVALLAPVLAPNRPGDQFADRGYAPPTRIRVRDAAGFRAPFVYRQVLEDRLLRRYAEDRSAPVRLRWFTAGRMVSVPEAGGPLLLLGADALGRDIFARVVHGARLSLGVTLVGAAGALLVGALVGGLAGGGARRADAGLMFLADTMLVLPGAYLVLVLRAVLPEVLSPLRVFGVLAAIFALTAWPHVARGVRAIVATERRREYAEAARAAGAGAFRMLRHVLPATRGFLTVEFVVLVPALLVAEATISYLGLGFAEPAASWGTMLQEAAHVRVIAEAPWMLAPAAALFLVVLGIHLAGGRAAPARALIGRPAGGRPH